MSVYSPDLEMWKSKSGAYFPTKEEAEAEDAAIAGGGRSSVDEDFSRNGPGGGIEVLGNYTPRADFTRDQTERTNALFTQGYTDLNHDGLIDDRDVALSKTPYGTPSTGGGTATTHQTSAPTIGTTNFGQNGQAAPRRNVPLESSTITTPGVGQQGFGGNQNAPANSGALDEAHNNSQETDAETKAEDRTLFQENLDQLRRLTGGDYEMSDEARAYQQEGLQMQRDLLEKLLGFDPNAYAASFADQALARQIAAGRSAGGGAAAQQAGMFAAMEQAPALYAEGQQQADALENQRLTQAENAIKSFGELGTSTRGQDETRQQFESQLQLSIGKTFSDAVQGKMELNEQERQRMSQVYVDFAQLQSIYDKMSSEEQLAELDRQMQQKGLDQQWKMFKEQLKADGQIKAKDIVNGFFSLGGGAIGAAGNILAAGAGKK